MAPWPIGCKRFHLSSSECVEITGGDQALFHLFLCKSLDERRVLHKNMVIKPVYPSAVLDASGLPMDQGYLKVRREPSKRRTAETGWASKIRICLGTLETPTKSSTANRKLLRRARMRGASPLRTCE